MTAIIFLLWTLLIYWMHRLAHALPAMNRFHMDHHKPVSYTPITGLHWKNAFLWFDTFESTADQWLTEVIPTILFAWFTGHWWIAVFYYVWAAFIQEAIEHNPKFDFYPYITSGKWHLIHHEHPDKNYGVFLPIWDMMFGTYKEK